MIITYELFGGIGVITPWETEERFSDLRESPSACLWIVPGTIDPMED